MRCELNSELGSLEVEPDTATALFRIFQEALTNVARHAGATRVDVELRVETDELLLRVRDNGRGIVPEELVNLQSLGLLGIRERARLLHGKAEVFGVAGQGTTVEVRVPLPAPQVDAGAAGEGTTPD